MNTIAKDPKDSGALFCRGQRILNKTHFDLVMNHGRKLVCGNYVLFGKLNDIGTSRLGLVVSKKVGSAVQRNLVKRRVRNSFRTSKEISLMPLDLVVLARPSVAIKDSNKVKPTTAKTFDECLTRFIKSLSSSTASSKGSSQVVLGSKR